ncbi:HEAT repeat domain-containing protein [Clostridium sp. LIBA-8841]|uniref:HEAT repeat domain-containing protein n=1 Tax=Clostridium sp. LIBA-8841 TaxID=2987530 RepID=UPI002AC5EB13|nr:HEAT repeat domain-containing protein [Clostridium sp. LIBA-8841]MDZ5253226.1 HEAT repeat domain-containing protein [Clostridium sp. LIBA-8841]
MQIVPYIFLSLILFIYIIFMSILYIKFEKLVTRKREEKISNIENEIIENIKTQVLKVTNNNNLSKDEILYVKKILRKSKSRQAFNNIISELNDVKSSKYDISKFMINYLEVIEYEIKKYRKKDSIKKCYFILNLGEYKVNTLEIQKFLIECLEDNSLYVRYNALNSIARIGKKENFIEALIYMSKNKIYLNNKVFIEVLDKFKNNYEVNKELLKNLDKLSAEIQCLIIDSFSKNKFDFCKESILMKLKEESHREVRISIIKYFGNNYYDEAQDSLIKLLSSKWWEERAMAAKSIGKYYSFEVENSLKESIKDENWYVRLNSASSILENNCTKEIVKEVLNSEDKYAKEILLYVLQQKNKTLYDKILDYKDGRMALTC